MSFRVKRIAIIGLGLIGGSLGLALKEARGPGVEIIGFSRHLETVAKAGERGVIDKAAQGLSDAVRDADLVAIATPVMTIKDVLEGISKHVSMECVVTDTGSSKGEVMRWADQYLPSAVSFVGGHPMAGKETSGLDEAEPGLFKGCVYCLTPAPRARQEAQQALTELVESIGATALLIDADSHDNLVAGVSHLPILLSAAFVSTTVNSPYWSDMARLAASGYRDMSRLASGGPELNRDICVTNRDQIIRWIDRYVEELRRYRYLIAEDSQGLINTLEAARKAREKWLRGGRP